MVLCVTHEGTKENRGDAKKQKDKSQGCYMGVESRDKDHCVEPQDGIESEFHHDAGEEDTDGRRRDSMSIGKPEMKGHDGRLSQKSAGNEGTRKEHQGIVTMSELEPIWAILSAPVTA